MKENDYIKKIAELSKTREDELTKSVYLLCESVADEVRETIKETLGVDTVCEVLFAEHEYFSSMRMFILINNPLLEKVYNVTTESERECAKWENRIEFAISISEKGILENITAQVVFFDEIEEKTTYNLNESIAFMKQTIQNSWASILEEAQ